MRFIMEAMADWTILQNSLPSPFLIKSVQIRCRYTHTHTLKHEHTSSVCLCSHLLSSTYRSLFYEELLGLEERAGVKKWKISCLWLALNVIFKWYNFMQTVRQDSSFPAPGRLYKLFNYLRTQSHWKFLILAHVFMAAHFECKLAKTSQLGESFSPQAGNISINAGNIFKQKQFLIVMPVCLFIMSLLQYWYMGIGYMGNFSLSLSFCLHISVSLSLFLTVSLSSSLSQSPLSLLS